MKVGDQKALPTIGKLLRLPQHPHYLSYLAAQLETDNQNWQVAWIAWKDYLDL